ncbi:MAG: hypothetical protein Q7S39_08040, partial [Ignavibacteria bacterium]|nr:hypothetical protein [Ignavibacteria bacterium]
LLRSDNVVMPINSASAPKARSALTPSHFHSIFVWRGEFFFLVWAMGLGQVSSKKKRRNSNAIQIQYRAFVHTIILMFMIKVNQTLGIRIWKFR